MSEGFFTEQEGVLHAEGVALAELAKRFGTPCYVYSRAALESALEQYQRALAGCQALVCFALKANSNLAILDLLARKGAGFDIVSGGELARVLAAGGDPAKVVFSGVGKTAAEIEQALRAGILCFNVESASELQRIESVARALRGRAPVSFRVNPDVDAGTHPYISTGLLENKFGVPFPEALALYRQAAASPHLKVTGLDVHIGSQITETAPFVESLDRVLGFIGQLGAQGIAIEHLDLGGGLGIRYQGEAPPPISQYIGALRSRLGALPLKLLVEPGRSLCGNAGVLLTRVEYLKSTPARHFAIVDAAMNDLMRPALYGAWHEIRAVAPRQGRALPYEVVGPVCESGDFLGHDRPLVLREGDLLAVMSAGAYGMSMSSNYNSRPRAAEVLVDGRSAQLIRERERLEDLYRGERRLA